jgi:hypothetical protein
MELHKKKEQLCSRQACILLAVLVVVIDESLIRLNALKQLISLQSTSVPQSCFCFWGESIGQSAARSPLAFPQNSSGGS